MSGVALHLLQEDILKIINCKRYLCSPKMLAFNQFFSNLKTKFNQSLVFNSFLRKNVGNVHESRRHLLKGPHHFYQSIRIDLHHHTHEINPLLVFFNDSSLFHKHPVKLIYFLALTNQSGISIHFRQRRKRSSQQGSSSALINIVNFNYILIHPFVLKAILSDLIRQLDQIAMPTSIYSTFL